MIDETIINLMINGFVNFKNHQIGQWIIRYKIEILETYWMQNLNSYYFKWQNFWKYFQYKKKKKNKKLFQTDRHRILSLCLSF